MENWLIYFAKVNGLLVVFYLMYFLFLRKETFFTSNRWYLILGLISSFVLPLIIFTKTIWIESKPVVFEQLTNYEPAFIQNATAVEESVNWNELFIAFYSIIALIFILKIGFEIASFYRTIKNQQRIKKQHFTLIHSLKATNPFSFFGYIIVNQQQFSEEELNHILLHESIHVKQKHSFDVLFSRIICAILWINPVVWLYRKAIVQNLEYIADNETFLTINNKHAYQKTLLKVVTSNNQLSITNHFFQSLIKKRIVMLNTNQSHKKKSWKYALLLPVLVAFMLLFQIETVAQSKDEPAEKVSYAVTSNYSSIVTKNTTDQEIKELEKAFSDEKHQLKISNVKRNTKDEIIAIKLVFDFGKTYNRVFERKSENPINSIKIYINSNEKDELSCGFVEDGSIAAVDETIEIDGLVANITKSKNWSFDSMKKDGKDVVFIVNGKAKAPKEKVVFSIDEEIVDMKEISANQYQEKYNKKADKDKLYFEVKTIKKPKIVENIDIGFKSLNKNSHIIQGAYVFDKMSTDNELENDCININEEYNISLKVNHLKRNEKGEIIEIKLSFDDNKGITGKTEQIRDIPIRPIFLKIKINENGKNEIGFFENHKMETTAKNNDKENKISLIENLNSDALIYVDGNIFTKEDLEYLDVDGLETITVLKDSESLKKYKATSQKEVIIIKTNWKKN